MQCPYDMTTLRMQKFKCKIRSESRDIDKNDKLNELYCNVTRLIVDSRHQGHVHMIS